MLSYWIPIKWFLLQLCITGNTLASDAEVEVHCDYECNIRKSAKVLMGLFGYQVVIVNEMFHLQQIKMKYLREFGLFGVYTFTNKGDVDYFNAFTYSYEHLFCVEYLPVDGMRPMYEILHKSFLEAVRGNSTCL